MPTQSRQDIYREAVGHRGTDTNAAVKACPHCEQSKPAGDFYLKQGRPTGWCKACMADYYRRDFDRSERTCEFCGVTFVPRRADQRNCSRACKTARRNRLASESLLATKAKAGRACVVCGNALPPSARADRRYCGESCIRRARKHIGNAQRRMRVPDQMEAISRADVYARDGWVCQLCGEPVDPEREYPDPLAASLDHVVPLSRGGTHDSTNLQLAHLTCNARARDMKANLDPRPPVVIDGRDYYRVPEAAEMIGTTRAILDGAIRAGRVPVYQPASYRYLTAQTVAELQATGLLNGRQHRSKAAEEDRERARIRRQRKCGTCGTVFDYPNPDNRRKFCSDACYRQDRNRRKRKTEEQKAQPTRAWEQPCTTCGKAMTVTQDRPRRFSCSPECARKRKAERERKRRGVVERKCAVCGGAIPPRDQPGRSRATCSPACRDEWPRLRSRQNYWARKTKTEEG